MSKNITSRTILVIVLVALLCLSIVSLAARPEWAVEGNWVRYQATISIQGEAVNRSLGVPMISAKVSLKVEIVEVDDRGFRVKTTIEGVEAEPQQAAQLLSTMASSFVEVGYIEFDKGPEEVSIYIDPAKLPEGAVVEKKEENGYVKATYDTSTGWLKRAEAKIESSDAAGVSLDFKIMLQDSNFVGGGFGDIAPIIIVAGIVGVLVVAIILSIRRIMQS